jgi:hypothetical protein
LLPAALLGGGIINSAMRLGGRVIARPPRSEDFLAQMS